MLLQRIEKKPRPLKSDVGFGGHMRITTKNAFIAGGFVVVAALIGAAAMFLTKGPTHSTEVKGTNNVTSVGQSGGITAKVVSQ